VTSGKNELLNPHIMTNMHFLKIRWNSGERGVVLMLVYYWLYVLHVDWGNWTSSSSLEIRIWWMLLKIFNEETKLNETAHFLLLYRRMDRAGRNWEINCVCEDTDVLGLLSSQPEVRVARQIQ
jgi:hypothetical protein